MPTAGNRSIHVAGVIMPCFVAFGKDFRIGPRLWVAESKIRVRNAALQLFRASLVVVVEHKPNRRIEHERRSGYQHVLDVRPDTPPGFAAVGRCQLELGLARLSTRNGKNATAAEMYGALFGWPILLGQILLDCPLFPCTAGVRACQSSP